MKKKMKKNLLSYFFGHSEFFPFVLCTCLYSTVRYSHLQLITHVITPAMPLSLYRITTTTSKEPYVKQLPKTSHQSRTSFILWKEIENNWGFGRLDILNVNMKINYENIPRFIIPLFLAGTLTVALMSLFDLSRAISVIISLFAVVQLQKFEIIWDIWRVLAIWGSSAFTSNRATFRTHLNTGTRRQ